MNLRSLALVLVASAFAQVTAFAQGGIYLAPTAIHVTNSTADKGPFAFLGEGNTSQTFYGATIGGYYNFYHQGKIDAGIDLRDAITHGNNASLNNFLFGARLSGSPFVRPIKPYAQVSVGLGTSRAPTSAVHASKIEYGAFVGADYTLNRHFDWRVFEVGYTSLQTISSSTVGSTNTVIPNSNLLNFSTGIVIRIP